MPTHETSVGGRRSPPRQPPDIRCHRRVRMQRRNRHTLTDRPRPSFRRHSAKSAAFPRTGMPFTVTTREGIGVYAKGLLPPAFTPALSLTPPTRFPEGKRAFVGHCKGHGAVTRGSVTTTRVLTPLLPPGTAVPGTDDPSTPGGSTDSAVDEAVCLARTDASRSALTASTTESPRPDVPRTS